MKDYAIIYNPTSGKKSQKDHLFTRKCLDDLSVSYELFETEFSGQAIDLADQLAKDGYQVIAAGGDGTCNEVMNGVITANSDSLCGFIPMGTGNDIPGVIGIRPDIKRACEIIVEGYTGKSDIGLAITQDGVKRYFLGIGSQGFDAEVTKRTNEAKKRFSGTGNYVVQVLKTLVHWKNREVKMKVDDDIYEGFANLIAVGNGPSYGGWMYICSNARIDDGQFHISVIDIGKLRLIYEFRKLYDASLFPHPSVHEFVSHKVRIEMKNPDDEPYLCQVDGEVLGTIPVNYEIIQEGCEFIRPEIDEVAEAFKKKYGRYFYECKET